jgi:hypothetical protein
MRNSGLILMLTFDPLLALLAAKALPAKVLQIGVFSSLTPPALPDWTQDSPFL